MASLVSDLVTVTGSHGDEWSGVLTLGEVSSRWSLSTLIKVLNVAMGSPPEAMGQA